MDNNNEYSFNCKLFLFYEQLIRDSTHNLNGELPENDFKENVLMKIANIMNANLITIHIYRHGELCQYAIYKKFKTIDRDNDICQKIKIAKEKFLWDQSFDRNESIIYNNYDPKLNDLSPEEQILIIPYNMGDNVRSLISVPLHIYMEIFGVLTIGKGEAYQFNEFERVCAEKIAKIIGPIIFQKLMLFDMSMLVHKCLNSKELCCHQLCCLFSKYLLADSVVLWEPTEKKSFIYKIAGWDNCPELEKFDELKIHETTFDANDDYWSSLLSKKKLKENELLKFIQIDKIERKNNVDKKWIKRHNFKWIGIATIPIKTVEDSPLPFFIIYFCGSNKPLGVEAWKCLLKYILEFAALNYEAATIRNSFEHNFIDILGHEMLHIINNINRNVKNIHEKYANKDDFNKDTEIFFSDIQDSVNQYISMIDTLKYRSQYIAKVDNYIMTNLLTPEFDDVIRRKQRKTFKVMNLKKTFRKHVNSIFRENTLNRGLINIDGISDIIEINMDEHAIQAIFDNIISNSRKYSISNSMVTAWTKDYKYSACLTIENYTECFDEKYLHYIFNKGTTIKKKKSKRSHGNGLYYAKGICQIYEIDLRCSLKKADFNNDRLCIFRTELLFPISLTNRAS